MARRTDIADRLTDPVRWTTGLQLVKTALAAALAWVLAVRVFHLEQPFLAPWAALLTVHATVFGTLKRGVQQVGATVLGVLLAFVLGTAFGLGAVSVAAAVLCGLVAGSLRGLRSETTTAAATALVVLTTGSSDDSTMLFSRLLDTGIGIAVGLLVNLVVWPPLRDRSAAVRIDAIDDRIGELLSGIAAELRRGRATSGVDDWVARTDEIDAEIDEAWMVLGQARESGRLNPRRSAAGRMHKAEGFSAVLTRLEQAVAETRSMARTIELAPVAPDAWDRRFRTPWLALLQRAGSAIGRADGEAIGGVRRDLDAFAASIDVADLPDRFWPVAGALVVNVRNILAALGDVADAQPVAVPLPAWRRTIEDRPPAAAQQTR